VQLLFLVSNQSNGWCSFFLHFLAGGPSNKQLAPLVQPFFVFFWLAMDQMAGAVFWHILAGSQSTE